MTDRTNVHPLRNKPLYLHSREELLAELANTPDDGYLTARHAAVFLNTNMNVLANWRNELRGPKFTRNGRFIRYRKSDLKAFMSEGAPSTYPTE
jgi:hypothetical protein